MPRDQSRIALLERIHIHQLMLFNRRLLVPNQAF
jgi:hypothetical protein